MSHLSRTSSSISVATTSCDTESTGYEAGFDLKGQEVSQSSFLQAVSSPESVGPPQAHVVAASGSALRTMPLRDAQL